MTAESGESMTERVEEFDVDRLLDLASEIDEYLLEFKQAIVGGDEEVEIADLAEDLWEVLDAIEDILEQIDLEEIPEAIDFDDIPEAVDVEDVPEGLFNEEENAIELTSVKEAVNLRELWDAVDLTDLYQEKQELEEEVDDVTDNWEDDDADGKEDDGLLGTDLMGDDEEDDEEDGVFENVVEMGDGAHTEFKAEARQAAIEETIRDAVVKFREMLLATHEKLEKLYRMNQEKLGQPGRQPNSLNPTATSTMPGGPVPETASLRTSTVPSQVKYSRIENPRRIYAHRFHEATGDESDDEQSADEEADESEEPPENAEVETDAEEDENAEVETDAEEDEEADKTVTEEGEKAGGTDTEEDDDAEPGDEDGEAVAGTGDEVETTELEMEPDTEDVDDGDEDEEIIIEVYDE